MSFADLEPFVMQKVADFALAPNDAHTSMDQILPDDVIQHILSFQGLKYKATNRVSKRWLRLSKQNEMNFHRQIQAAIVSKGLRAIWCANCGDVICDEPFEEIEFPRKSGQTQKCFAVEKPLPCESSNNCWWSYSLGISWLMQTCTGCKTTVGFHVHTSDSERFDAD